MVSTAEIVLGLAALGGLTLAVIRLSGTPRPPAWIALGHCAVASTSLALLILAVSKNEVGCAGVSVCALW